MIQQQFKNIKSGQIISILSGILKADDGKEVREVSIKEIFYNKWEHKHSYEESLLDLPILCSGYWELNGDTFYIIGGSVTCKIVTDTHIDNLGKELTIAAKELGLTLDYEEEALWEPTYSIQ